MSTIENIKSKIATFLEYDSPIPKGLLNDYENSIRNTIQKDNKGNGGVRKAYVVSSDNIQEIEPIQKEIDPIELIRKGEMAIENDNQFITIECINKLKKDYQTGATLFKYLYINIIYNPNIFLQVEETDLPSIKATELIKIIESKK